MAAAMVGDAALPAPAVKENAISKAGKIYCTDLEVAALLLCVPTVLDYKVLKIEGGNANENLNTLLASNRQQLSLPN